MMLEANGSFGMVCRPGRRANTRRATHVTAGSDVCPPQGQRSEGLAAPEHTGVGCSHSSGAGWFRHKDSPACSASLPTIRNPWWNVEFEEAWQARREDNWEHRKGIKIMDSGAYAVT